jgi:hypothetical protein
MAQSPIFVSPYMATHKSSRKTGLFVCSVHWHNPSVKTKAKPVSHTELHNFAPRVPRPYFILVAMVLICPLPNSGVVNVMVLGGRSFKMWLGHEGSSQEMELEALIKGLERGRKFVPFAFLLCHVRMQFSSSKGCSIILEAETWRSPDNKPANPHTLILHLLARDRFLFFTNHPICGVLLQQHKQTRMSLFPDVPVTIITAFSGLS